MKRTFDGHSLKKYYCKKCNKHICWQTAIFGSGLCGSCSQYKRFKTPQDNPMFGVHRYGKDNPNYIDGRSYEPYSAEFNKVLKASIRNRDNHECQLCHMKEEEHIKKYNKVLDIHHIDYNKKNCQEENLITLCKRCNIKANYNRNFWIEKFYKIIKEKFIREDK
jgi:hypothetical protein